MKRTHVLAIGLVGAVLTGCAATSSAPTSLTRPGAVTTAPAELPPTSAPVTRASASAARSTRATPSTPAAPTTPALSIPSRIGKLCSAAGYDDEKIELVATTTAQVVTKDGITKTPQEILDEVNTAIDQTDSLNVFPDDDRCVRYFDVYAQLASLASPAP